MKSNVFLCLICSILMFFVLITPGASMIAALESIHLWMNSVFPSLFPFFVLTSILKQTGVIEQLIYNSSNKLDYNLVFITLIGLICGYPSTSKLIGQSKSIENPIPIYALSTSPSPVFIIGTVATVFLQNTVLAIYLIFATYLSLFTSYLITKAFYKNHSITRPAPGCIKKISLGHLITGSILDGMKAQAIILGIMIVVSILGVFMEKTGIFYALSTILSPFASLIGIPKTAIIPFFKGLMEMTTGVNSICAQNISIYHKLALCGFVTSFGGMSIILESISFINEKIKAISILGIKLLHGCLTFLYIKLLLMLFPISQSVARMLPTYQNIGFAFSFFTSLGFCLLILLMLHQIAHQGS